MDTADYMRFAMRCDVLELLTLCFYSLFEISLKRVLLSLRGVCRDHSVSKSITGKNDCSISCLGHLKYKQKVAHYLLTLFTKYHDQCFIFENKHLFYINDIRI